MHPSREATMTSLPRPPARVSAVVAILGVATIVAGRLPGPGSVRAEVQANAQAEGGVVPSRLLLDARRVAVLGDSVTYDGRWVALVTAWMERQGTAAEVIDVGLPSETVSGLSEEGHADGAFPRPDLAERLDRVLRLVRPDVVLACYGMNCGVYQPFDEDRFGRFRAGIERLHAAVEAAGATIVHLTPPAYRARPDAPGPAAAFFPSGRAAEYDQVLATYAEWLRSKRADGWLVIDLHEPMRASLDAAQAQPPEGTATDPAEGRGPAAHDPVHPNDAGHWAIFRAVLEGIGADAVTPDEVDRFLPEIGQRMRILRDAYLAAAGHTRPGLPEGLPIAEAEARARAITASIRSRRLQLMGALFPTGEWRMPITWPRPRVVDPGPAPRAVVPPPPDAVVLFDGHSLDRWDGGEGWTVADGIATVGHGDIETLDAFGDCQLHVEFRTPADTRGKGQGRANSGIFLMGRYEIQILDSFEDGTDKPLTYPDGQCGALYKQQPPAVNACRPPGQWQVYDIFFTAPRFTPAGDLESPGRVSVMHNGIAIHSDTVILGDTSWREPPAYHQHPERLPLRLQDHNNPVQFRSIWIRPFEAVRGEATDE
jgi:lysophospholipase L1-like esterase